MEQYHNEDLRDMKGQIAYHDTIIDGLQDFIKENLERMYTPSEEINEKKEIYLEQKQINTSNFDRLREQLVNSQQAQEQLQELEEKYKIVNAEKNNKDLIIQELQLKLSNPTDIRDESYNLNQGLPEINENKSEYGLLLDKINKLINNQSNKSEGSPFQNNVFDEHNKLLMNKRMSDIDEKLYDLTRKLNNRDLDQPRNYSFPLVAGDNIYSANPFQRISNINSQQFDNKLAQEYNLHSNLYNNYQNLQGQNPSLSESSDSKLPIVDMKPNPFQRISKMDKLDDNSRPLPASTDNSSQDTKQKDEPGELKNTSPETNKYDHLFDMITNIDRKYSELLSRDKQNSNNVSPVTVNINNDSENQSKKEVSPPSHQTENNSRRESEKQSGNSFSENESDDDNSYNFGKVSNPFDYIYNDTDDIIFEKKPILSGGRKIDKFKKLRKLK